MKKMLLSSLALLFLTVISFAQQTKPVSSKKTTLASKKMVDETFVAKKLNQPKKDASLKLSPFITTHGEKKE